MVDGVRRDEKDGERDRGKVCARRICLEEGAEGGKFFKYIAECCIEGLTDEFDGGGGGCENARGGCSRVLPSG